MVGGMSRFAATARRSSISSRARGVERNPVVAVRGDGAQKQQAQRLEDEALSPAAARREAHLAALRA